MNKNIYNPNSAVYLDYGYLMLPLSLSVIPKIKIGHETFFYKNGYHVSLLRLRNLSESQQKQVLSFVQKYPVKLKKITRTYRLVVEENRQSIMVRVYLQGLKKLIAAVNEHFSYNFAYPPTHITLFTLKNMEGGIGVDSYSEYKLLTHQISQKDAQKLTRSFKLIGNNVKETDNMKFADRVYGIVKKVPKGSVITYKQIADKMGNKAYRAIGQALKRNPDLTTIPCHRVIKSDGGVGGYLGKTDKKSVNKKIALLRAEGIQVIFRKVRI